MLQAHSQKSTPLAAEMLAAAEAADRAADAPSPEEQARAVMDVFAHKEAVKLALMEAALRGISETRRQECLPLRDEGDDFGQVEARIPKNLLFHLGQQRNLGWDGLYDDSGLKDVLKAYPHCRVKTVSGKTVVGWRGRDANAPSRRVHFGPGTMRFAS